MKNDKVQKLESQCQSKCKEVIFNSKCINILHLILFSRRNVTMENVCVFAVTSCMCVYFDCCHELNGWKAVMDVGPHTLCVFVFGKQYATHAKHNKSVSLISAPDC